MYVILTSIYRPSDKQRLSAMTKNMGSLDRIIRTLAAVLIAILYFTGQIGGVTATILGVIAIVFLLTSFVGSCPAYLPFGWSTRSKTAA